MSLARRLRDPSLIGGVACLLLVCGAAIWNLWFVDSLRETSYHRAQTTWIVLGLIGAGIIAGMDMHFFRRISGTLYQVLMVMLLVVLIFGREINRSRRWIELGPVNLQPSEFMKLAMVLVLANWFKARRSSTAWGLRQLLVPLATLLFPIQDVPWMICRCRLLSSTTSKSTSPIRPTPAAAR